MLIYTTIAEISPENVNSLDLGARGYVHLYTYYINNSVETASFCISELGTRNPQCNCLNLIFSAYAHQLERSVDPANETE